ncbi:MAG: class I SAM-dependent methyltransferase [Pseudomonadota bacterium]
MTSTVWSQCVQGAETLDFTREARFSDNRKAAVLSAAGLMPGMRVLEVGCGPGALCRKLAQWLSGESHVTGLDRDTGFVRHARARASQLRLSNVRFIEGDALSLPFDEGAFDACLSHTVLEHVPHLAFLEEQRRVCRVGGHVAVFQIMPEAGVRTHSPSLPGLTPEETELRKPIDEASQRNDRARGIAAYPVSAADLPFLFERAGLQQVRVDAIAFPVAIDNADLSGVEREAIVRSEEALARESLEIGLRQADTPLPPQQERRLRELTESRLAARRAALAGGQRFWQYSVTLALAASGIK